MIWKKYCFVSYLSQMPCFLPKPNNIEMYSKGVKKFFLKKLKSDENSKNHNMVLLNLNHTLFNKIEAGQILQSIKM